MSRIIPAPPLALHFKINSINKRVFEPNPQILYLYKLHKVLLYQYIIINNMYQNRVNIFILAYSILKGTIFCIIEFFNLPYHLPLSFTRYEM